jgi:hypothetical protein
MEMNPLEESMDAEAIFVFGSNLAGRHGRGAALEAAMRWGAERGVGAGRTGRAYAIPTKDGRRWVDAYCRRTLPLEEIGRHVADFIEYARQNPHLRFFVTALGTGLAGHSHADMAPLFAGAPVNCHLPGEWVQALRMGVYADLAPLLPALASSGD